MRQRVLFFVLLLSLLMAVAPMTGAQEDRLQVVATYSILGDLVRNIAGDNIELTVLVGPDGDSHVYEPTPQDAIALAEADILFENGLEFETWLDDLYESSGSTATRIVVSDGIEPLAFRGHDHAREHEEVTDLSPWSGEWVSGWSFGIEAMQPAFDAVLEATPELTQDDILAYYELGNQSAFDTFAVNGETITFAGSDGSMTCTYVFTGSETVVAFPTETWSLFATNDPACEAYRYLLVMPPHASEPGSSPHFHFRYGSSSFDELIADDSPWYPSLYPQNTTLEQVMGSWIASARAVGLYIASVQGIEVEMTDREIAALEGGEEAAHDHDEAGSMLRLAVNDYENGTVNIIDLSTGEVVATYDLSARATLYTSESGRYAYAVQGSGNIVNVIDSGVRQIWHDDHYDTEIGDVALLDFALEGQRPIHFVLWDDQVSVFNDGDGSVAIFNESDLHNADVEIITLATERPHHGVGAAVGDYILAGIPNMADEDDSLPVGVAVYTMDDEEVARFEDCPGLHGEAHAGENGIAFACSDGVLIVSWQGDEFIGTKLDYPEGSGDNRAGTLNATHDGQYVLGNFGPDGLIAIDYAAGTIEQIELPTEVWRFAVYTEDPTKAVVLTMDGSLHLVDITTGELEGSVAVVDPFTRPSRPAARPTFVLNGHIAYVSEPLPGDIAVVDLATMEVEEERLFVGGKPSSLATFGVMGEDHHTEDDHDHEGEAHAHVHGEFDPHVWHDPNNGIVMVENIRDALVAADPENAETYEANAEAYIADLTVLDTYIREQVATIPEANRILVTSHDTFGYFADAYGFEVMNVLGSVSTEVADPGAGEIAELIGEIQERGVPAIFTENISNPALVEQVANEAGVFVAPTLYTDALGQSGTPGETYLSMLRYNIDTITEALQ